MINCSVCFENKPLSEMKLNKNCGHACLCKECFSFYINTIIELNETSTVYNNNNNNALNCPICREYGEYTNIYTTNASDNSYNSESEDDELNINKGVLNKLLEYGLSQYYEITTKRDNLCFYLKDNNINTSINIGNIKFGFDYDYESNNRIKTSEQISIGTKVNLRKDINLIASIRKDLMKEKSIGNALGLHYENDCLAINFDYFKDFTAVGDIKDSHGFSFTITLKPFGTSKQQGKTRNFGPDL